MLGEARVEARSILRDAAGERDTLLAEARRIRALLEAALAATGEATGTETRAPTVGAGDDTGERWGEAEAA
jgi:hypothetical protein